MVLNLETLFFGTGEANNEPELEKYFLQTPEYADLLSGRYNLVIGPKGSGKTALFVMLSKEARTGILFIPASAVKGQLEYELLLKGSGEEKYSVENLREFWKKYIAIRIAQKILTADFPISDAGTRLDAYTAKFGFKEMLPKLFEFKPNSVSGVIDKIREILNTPKYFDYAEVLALSEEILKLNQHSAWVLLDRLDEMVVNGETTQVNLLHALLLAMKDLNEYGRIKIISFLREDLHGRIPYVHIDQFESTTRSIKWSRDSLLLLIARRIADLKGMPVDITLPVAESLFFEVFEQKIPSSNAKNSFDWMVNHLSDGRGITTPRDLVLLCNKSRDSQNSNQFTTNKLVSGKALVAGYNEVASSKWHEFQVLYPNEAKLSQKLITTEVAENYGRITKEQAQIIFSVQNGDINNILKKLLDSGFLRPENKTNPISSKKFEIPHVYRLPLGIKSSGRKKRATP